MSLPLRHRAFAGWVLPAICVAVYGMICVLLYSSIVKQNNGTFTYALDDTYIHLALSDSIAHGTYGINPGETVSPSSSIVWPFLLAPFARSSWFVYAPLILNLVFGCVAAWLLGVFVRDYRGDDLAAGEVWRRLLSAVALVFIANLPALTLIAMEHVLQVLLSVACAWGVVACLRGQRVPWWCIAAALAGPAVRYEAVGVTLALGICLWGQRRRVAALGLVLSLAPLLLFAVFLHRHGLPGLPLSVLVKGHAVWAQYDPAAVVAVHFQELLDNFHYAPIVWLIALVFVMLSVAAAAEKQRVRRYALAGSAAAVGLHLFFGRFGWNDRYEVYIVVFGVLVLLELDWERPHGSAGWYAVGLLACSSLYIQGTTSIGWNAHSIYLQQLQTSRFTHSLPNTNVAVNDLGLVSFQHPGSQYVLDLFGLGSLESATVPHTTSWMAWSELGELCRPTGVDNCVTYFATDAGQASRLRQRFEEFVKTVPREVIVKLPERSADVAMP